MLFHVKHDGRKTPVAVGPIQARSIAVSEHRASDARWQFDAPPSRAARGATISTQIAAFPWPKAMLGPQQQARAYS